jgi:hypothetical protein
VRILFRTCPILLLVPLVRWAWAWLDIVTGEDLSWYVVWPIIGLVISAALWHVTLVIIERGRRVPYLVYAILHMPIFNVVANIALIFATHFPLLEEP